INARDLFAQPDWTRRLRREPRTHRPLACGAGRGLRGMISTVRHRRAGAAIALSCAWLLALAVPARADRWFGSVQVDCESFGLCAVSPAMPDPPGDPESIEFDRTGKANAPLEIMVRVNKPVEGGTPIRLTFGETVFDLQPGTDVLTRRDA